MAICEVANKGSSPFIHPLIPFGGIGRRDGLKTYFHLEYWFDSNNGHIVFLFVIKFSQPVFFVVFFYYPHV